MREKCCCEGCEFFQEAGIWDNDMQQNDPPSSCHIRSVEGEWPPRDGLDDWCGEHWPKGKPRGLIEVENDGSLKHFGLEGK